MADLASRVLAIVSALTLLALVAFTLSTSKRRLASIALAFVLVANALDSLPASALGLTSIFVRANLDYWANMALTIALPIYLIFVGQVVSSPLAWPFRERAAIVSLTIVAGALALGAIAAPSLFAVVDADGFLRFTTLARSIFLLAVPLYLYTLACAVSAFRRASPATPSRRQAALYLAAFGLLEVSFLTDIALEVATGGGDILSRFLAAYGFSILNIVTASLLVYAMLQYQLLGIDLKIKWTLQRGTVAAVFVAVFFVVAEVAQNYLSTNLGWLAGGVAAGFLVFALRPLERAASTLANAAMPRVADTEQYRLERRRDIYKAAVESATDDGQLTAKERAMLATLADELGLGAREALEIELASRRRLPLPPA
ncbi:MAG TPA: hypothetical protein VM370_06690 [Candidatus Thermoplasmatota archaeon]|nr:hypothetical protein [Candidatus Thermoplasmatota archaeon]